MESIDWEVFQHLPEILYCAFLHQWNKSSLLHNRLLPLQHQAITWITANLSSTWLQGRNFHEIKSKHKTFCSRKMHLKIVVCKSGGHFVQVSLCQSIILPDKILCIVHTMSCCASIVSHLVRGAGHSCMFDGNLETRKWPTRCKQHSWTYFLKLKVSYFNSHFNGLMQERRNFSALAMELRLSCTSPSICLFFFI